MPHQRAPVRREDDESAARTEDTPSLAEGVIEARNVFEESATRHSTHGISAQRALAAEIWSALTSSAQTRPVDPTQWVASKA